MTEQKHHSLSRRSLLGDQLGLILALVIVPNLAAACGTPDTAEQSGNVKAPAKKAARSSSDGRASRNSRSNDVDASGDLGSEDLADSNPDLSDADPLSRNDKDTQIAQSNKTTSQVASNQPTASLKADSKVTGAKPDGGFFSRGAPQLSLAQIESGQQIRAKCEGGFHELVIEPEHLQALAQGQSVTIKGSTNTHFANPTVHNHSVTYSPVMG